MRIHNSPNPGENVHDETEVFVGPVIFGGSSGWRGVTLVEQIGQMNQLESDLASGKITQAEYSRMKTEYVNEFTDPRNRRNLR